MQIKLAGLFNAYTKGQNDLHIKGETITEVLVNLDHVFPGIRFRFIDEQEKIRTHINLYLNNSRIEDIHRKIKDTDTLFIVQALSGG